MKNATDTLHDLEEEATESLGSNAARTNPDIRKRLELRIMEIRNLLHVTMNLDEHPPTLDKMAYYMRTAEDVARRIANLKKDPISCGDHARHLKS